MQIKQLRNDEEFLRLMPLVVEFSIRTKMPIYRHMKEVASSVDGEKYFTQFGEVEGNPVRYICGYFMSEVDFMVTQLLVLGRPQEGKQACRMFEKMLREKGVTKVFMMTHLNPRVFKKYGFEFERVMLSKVI